MCMSDYINELLRENVSNGDIEAILEKAARFQGLAPKEAAALLTLSDETYTSRIFEIAGQIKNHIYGERIVLFAPLYVSDYCVNSCAYCGFKGSENQKRRRLSQSEVQAQVAILEKMGHKRLAIEAGEDPINCPLDYILGCIDTIYTTSDIRRVNVNIAALDTKGYRRLKAANIGTYILFQETYHRPSYAQFHPVGPKGDYDYHFGAFERAMEAGLDDVGAGVLFGLYDYKYEALALMLHNEALERRYGVGFHTISVPRIRDIESGRAYPYGVSDADFLKLVAILRIAVPFTGMIISTRETPEMRRRLIRIGISQMSAGSSAAVGGYTALSDVNNPVILNNPIIPGLTRDPISSGEAGRPRVKPGVTENDFRGKESSSSPQFSLSDNRSADEIFYWLMEEGILPSFCTACYRRNRSGARFMEMAKKGDIKNICLPNGLLTLKEYALDYGDARFKALADTIITQKLTQLENPATVQAKLHELEQGKRDIYI